MTAIDFFRFWQIFRFFAHFGRVFSHRFSHGIMGYRAKRFAEKAFLLDTIVAFNYIVVQMDNQNI